MNRLVVVVLFQVNSDDDDDDDDETISCEDIQATKDSFYRSTSMSDTSSIPANSLPTKPTKVTSSEALTPIGRKTVLARAELWDRRISTNENETNQQPVVSYDIEQWSHEFEKIQNAN